MSCLTLTVTDKSQQDLRIGTALSNTPLAVTTERAHAPMALRLRHHNTPPTIAAIARNTPLSIAAALVCRIGNNKWDYFEVAEGPLVVEEGYLKVYHD